MIHRVTDPRTGIVRTLKFMPAVAEVVDACEEAAKAVRAQRHIAKLEAYGLRWGTGTGNVNCHGMTLDEIRREQRELPPFRDWPDEPDPEIVARIAAPPKPKKLMSPDEHERFMPKLRALRVGGANAFEPRDDGKHGERVARDLAAREARRSSNEP